MARSGHGSTVTNLEIYCDKSHLGCNVSGFGPLHGLINYDIISPHVVAEPRSIISRYLFGKNFIQ
jgi:hypothetical protein